MQKTSLSTSRIQRNVEASPSSTTSLTTSSSDGCQGLWVYHSKRHTAVRVRLGYIQRPHVLARQTKEFVPERFVGLNVDFRGTNLCYTPFGAGRRICPGLSMGVRMLSTLLGSLVHHFDWKLPDGRAPEDIDMGEKFGLTLQRATPLVAIPVVVT